MSGHPSIHGEISLVEVDRADGLGPIDLISRYLGSRKVILSRLGLEKIVEASHPGYDVFTLVTAHC